jgi:hypothetical protein
MGHLRAIAAVVLESEVNNLSTKIMRVMLDPNDLLHLNEVQKQLFDMGFLGQLAEKVVRGGEGTRVNAAVIVGDCLQYYAMASLPFEIAPFLNLLGEGPSVQTALLYLFENLAISNPELFPEDEAFLGKVSEPVVILYLSYLAYDCHHRSSLDISLFRDMDGHGLLLLLAVGMQRRKYVDGADVWAQSPEEESRRQLACANCFITAREGLQKGMLVHYASLFFSNCASWTNPYASGSQAQSEFFPQSFLAWGANLFSLVNRGRLIHATTKWSIGEPEPLYDISPDESHAQLLGMNGKTSDVLRDNDLWQARYEALERQHSGLQQKFADVKAQLIASRCQQLVGKGDS